MLLNVVMLY